MIQKIWNKILENENVRQNLSKLRELVKEQKNKEECKKLAKENHLVLENLLESEDAKSARICLAVQSADKWLNTASVAITSLSQYSATFGHNDSGTGLSQGRPSSW